MQKEGLQTYADSVAPEPHEHLCSLICELLSADSVPVKSDRKNVQQTWQMCRLLWSDTAHLCSKAFFSMMCHMCIHLNDHAGLLIKCTEYTLLQYNMYIVK